MSVSRISVSQIRSISPENRKTWPVDLQVWVELISRHPNGDWQPPFYLSVDQLLAFRKKARQPKVRA